MLKENSGGRKELPSFSPIPRCCPGLAVLALLFLASLSRGRPHSLKVQPLTKSSPVSGSHTAQFHRPAVWEEKRHPLETQCTVPQSCVRPCQDLSPGHQEPLVDCPQDISAWISHRHCKLSLTSPKTGSSFLPFNNSTILLGTQAQTSVPSDCPFPFVSLPASSHVLSIMPQAVCLSPSFLLLDHLSYF